MSWPGAKAPGEQGLGPGRETGPAKLNEFVKARFGMERDVLLGRSLTWHAAVFVLS